MQNSVTTSIDPDSCIGCGLCVEVCPAKTLSMHDGKAVVSGRYSMGCGHCEAVCPVDGEYDTAQLVRLMRSRRSCRNYTDREVDPKLLDDLVKIGTTAPSGTNSQLWTFSILASRREVVILGEHVARFYDELNRMAEKSWLRFLSKYFSSDALGKYYRRHYETVRKRLLLWKRKREDALFHGATAVIIVGGKETASSPMEDGLLASQNIMLAAHSLGLGTCMIGFAVEAIKRDKNLRKLLEILDDESIFAVIALGYPAEQYDKAVLRKKIVPHYPALHRK
jgi:nitroreductase